MLCMIDSVLRLLMTRTSGKDVDPLRFVGVASMTWNARYYQFRMFYTLPKIGFEIDNVFSKIDDSLVCILAVWKPINLWVNRSLDWNENKWQGLISMRFGPRSFFTKSVIHQLEKYCIRYTKKSEYFSWWRVILESHRCIALERL
jgi:hypothetical protein